MATVRIRDDLGRDVFLPRAPHRIVSLVPSDTYTIFALGCADRLVGRTRYCDAPAAASSIPEVGGTKDVDVAAVLDLRPDLVIANQEENARPALEQLARHVPLLVSLPRRVADAIAHVARLARALRVERVPEVAGTVRAGYALLNECQPPQDPIAVFVPIWMNPLMTFNADTYGSDVLGVSGARNVFGERLRLYPLAADLGKSAPRDAGERDVRYPRLRPDEIAAHAPRVVLVPDEPYTFSDDEIATLARDARAPAVRCSGKDLFWYGAWTIEAVPRVKALVDGLRRGDVAAVHRT